MNFAFYQQAAGASPCPTMVIFVWIKQETYSGVIASHHD